jgi:hypothetical protein
MRVAEAELHAARGDRVAAAAAFEEAIAAFVDRRSVIHLAQTLIVRAGLARAAGDTAAARADLTRARDTAAPCHAEPLVMRATALLAELGNA